MGYYTTFHLEVGTKSGRQVDEETLDKVRDAFDQMFGYQGAFDDVLNYDTNDWKWYEYEVDMKELSTEFPDLLFELEGEGEDREDWWVAWFCNGRVYQSHAKVIPPDSAPPTDDYWE